MGFDPLPAIVTFDLISLLIKLTVVLVYVLRYKILGLR